MTQQPGNASVTLRIANDKFIYDMSDNILDFQLNFLFCNKLPWPDVNVNFILEVCCFIVVISGKSVDFP